MASHDQAPGDTPGAAPSPARLLHQTAVLVAEMAGQIAALEHTSQELRADIARLERRADDQAFTISFQACELGYLASQLRDR